MPLALTPHARLLSSWRDFPHLTQALIKHAKQLSHVKTLLIPPSLCPHARLPLCILGTLLTTCGTSHPVLGCPPSPAMDTLVILLGLSPPEGTGPQSLCECPSHQTQPTLGCRSPLPYANSCSPGVLVEC